MRRRHRSKIVAARGPRLLRHPAGLRFLRWLGRIFSLSRGAAAGYVAQRVRRRKTRGWDLGSSGPRYLKHIVHLKIVIHQLIAGREALALQLTQHFLYVG